MLRWSFVSCWLGWLELLALGRSGFVSQPAFAGHVAQKAASLALCAGFGLYTTCLVGVGVGSRSWPCRSATQRSGDSLCGPHLGSARGGHLRVNLLRKLCFCGLKMVSAGPLFIGWAGHTCKNRGGCAGLTVSELGLSLLSFSGRTVASKPSRAGRWDANKRRGGRQGLLGVSVFLVLAVGHWLIWTYGFLRESFVFAAVTFKNLKADCPKCVRAFTPYKLYMLWRQPPSFPLSSAPQSIYCSQDASNSWHRFRDHAVKHMAQFVVPSRCNHLFVETSSTSSQTILRNWSPTSLACWTAGLPRCSKAFSEPLRLDI